jgi:polyhydroxybutyrate depolymerase
MTKPISALAALLMLAGACSSEGAGEATASATSPSSATTETSQATTTAPPTTVRQTTESIDTTPQTTTRDLTEEPSGCATGEPGIFVVAIGDVQQMSVVVPSGFNGSPLPVVMDFHGVGSDGLQEAALTSYPALAEQETFIVAHPTGKSSPIDGRNTWELAQFDIPDQDDLALVNEMIDKLTNDFCGDASRVYSTGMSNGGLFTSRLVCDLADRIAAAVSVAGVTHHDECEPARPVPMMAYHGTSDKIVPFEGGVSTQPNGDDDFFKQVMPDEFAEFAADFNCNPDPSRTEVSIEVIRYEYSDCDDDVPMIFHEITGGGHTWPNSALGPFIVEFFGKTTTDVDATADGWAFMSQFSLPT